MSSPASWYLEGFESPGEKTLRAALRTLPFSVGRRSSCDLALNSKMVSQQHAEIFFDDKGLWVRDLGSTNGTFVNGMRVESIQVLQAGDILHFADLEFHLVEMHSEPSEPGLAQTLRMSKASIEESGAKFRELREMLRAGEIEAHYQPLVRLRDNAVLGYECLGRGQLDGVPTSPGVLFGLAETIGLATELSVAFRDCGVEQAEVLPPSRRLFLNTHPAELKDEAALLRSLETLVERHPERRIVLEIHESAVTNANVLRSLGRELDLLGIAVAFDDFGTGQARLLELTEAAPHYLKFDVALISGIHLATKQRRDMVQALVNLVRELGILAIAEGVEHDEEAVVCTELGFQYGQGYHFGRPAPARTLKGA